MPKDDPSSSLWHRHQIVAHHCCVCLLQPHRKKKSFIEKKKAVTFHLVHRSQRDPLAADEKAPQHVLLPATKVRTNEEPKEPINTPKNA